MNTNISALDLLEFDLTNAELLKKKIFINQESSDELSDFTPLKKKPQEKLKNIEAIKPSDINKLKTNAKERSVPSSRLSRVANFASLGWNL